MLMTAYVVFTALDAGEITLESPVIMSKQAYGVPYASHFLKPGDMVTMDDALKIMLTRAALDVAIAIAQSIGAGYDDFVRRMNAEARTLGMDQSHFANPHGLHDWRQVTSASDLALLARVIITNYPRYKHYFHFDAIMIDRTVRRNTNILLRRYEGTTGLRGGYTCESGWNIVASAKRDGRELIAVVLGARSALDRAERAAVLLDHGFARLSEQQARSGIRPSRESSAEAYAEPPNMRSVVCAHDSGSLEASARTPSYKVDETGAILVDTGAGFSPAHIGWPTGPRKAAVIRIIETGGIGMPVPRPRP